MFRSALLLVGSKQTAFCVRACVPECGTDCHVCANSPVKMFAGMAEVTAGNSSLVTTQADTASLRKI